MKGVHMDNIKKRLGNLLSVKSLVTLVLTGVFAYMAVVDKISQDFICKASTFRVCHSWAVLLSEPAHAGSLMFVFFAKSVLSAPRLAVFFSQPRGL